MDNTLIYATSNLRHLLPEYMKDNESYRHTPDGEIHPGGVVEKKIYLSERFDFGFRKRFKIRLSCMAICALFGRARVLRHMPLHTAKK